MSTPQDPLVLLQHCSVVMDGKAVLDDVSFALRTNERWVLLGDNGAGKTLLMKLLRGDVWPTPTGQERTYYAVDGEGSEQPLGSKSLIAYLGPERQDRYVRYEWNHSVTQVVTTGLFDEEIPRTTPTSAQRMKVTALLRRFRLWSLRDRGFLSLSYGQRRRALVARALASSPRVLLLDEVFNGLDASSATLLRSSLEAQSTWVVATHRLDEVPRSATHIARMADGRIVEVTRYQPPRRQPRRARRPIRPQSSTDLSRRRAALIELRNVNLYRDYRPVLRDLNWRLARGEHWAIVGRNGSGKSSFLKLLYGDLQPRLGGSIERAGITPGTPIATWKQRVGFVSPELQADYFLARDLEEVVMSGRYASVGLNDAPTQADRRAAKRWLRFFGIDSIAHRQPREVSYGQMRLALLARAMINNPKLLLLDEPCTGLSPAMTQSVLKLLQRLSPDVQLVMAVHDRRDLPAAVQLALSIEPTKRVSVISPT